MFSKSCIYALRASVYVAAAHRRDLTFVPIRTIAEALGLSFHFLTKILQSLTQDGILVSHRGPAGGVALGRAPEDISLLDVIRAVDGDALFRECLLGLKGCGEDKPCPLHDSWVAVREQLRAMFEQAHLGPLADGVVEHALRLHDAAAPVVPGSRDRTTAALQEGSRP